MMHEAAGQPRAVTRCPSDLMLGRPVRRPTYFLLAVLVLAACLDLVLTGRWVVVVLMVVFVLGSAVWATVGPRRPARRARQSAMRNRRQR
jgi:hypothetical protein